MNKTKTHTQELLNDITSRVLSESLVFLDPRKVCQLLFNVLADVLHDLDTFYTGDLLTKLIFYSEFMTEQYIRKEPLSYPKARGIINWYDQMYYIMEKSSETISEIFDVTIPSSEMAMITEIFLPYMQDVFAYLLAFRHGNKQGQTKGKLKNSGKRHGVEVAPHYRFVLKTYAI